MIEAKLVPHPAHPPLSVQSIGVCVWRDVGRIHLRYLVEGAQQLILPAPANPDRADDLWKTTCLEAFVGSDGTGYAEFNFSPSSQWAAYAFDAPRERMHSLGAEVEVWLEGGDDWIAVEAAVSVDLKQGASLNLTAVIEEAGGHKSYWALAHPDGPPDFHDPSCFVARLPE